MQLYLLITQTNVQTDGLFTKANKNHARVEAFGWQFPYRFCYIYIYIYTSMQLDKYANYDKEELKTKTVLYLQSCSN